MLTLILVTVTYILTLGLTIYWWLKSKDIGAIFVMFAFALLYGFLTNVITVVEKYSINIYGSESTVKEIVLP